MTQQIQSKQDVASESQGVQVDLLEMGAAIWFRRIPIACLTIVCSIASVFYALSLPDRYTSSALLAPVESANASAASAFNISQVTGLGAFGLGGGSRDEKELTLAILTSKQFIEKFLEENQLVPQLFATTGWDGQQNQLIYNTEIYNPDTNEWLFKEESKTGPSPGEAFSSFMGNLGISDDSNTGFVTFSFEHFSPYVVRDVLLKLISAINKEMKSKDIDEAQKNIEYLTDLASSTQVVPLQQAIFSLIESEVRRSMLASVKDDYAFQYIDPPVVPEMRSDPNRRLIVILGTMVGFMLGAFLSLASYLVTTVGKPLKES